MCISATLWDSVPPLLCSLILPAASVLRENIFGLPHIVITSTVDWTAISSCLLYVCTNQLYFQTLFENKEFSTITNVLSNTINAELLRQYRVGIFCISVIVGNQFPVFKTKVHFKSLFWLIRGHFTLPQITAALLRTMSFPWCSNDEGHCAAERHIYLMTTQFHRLF